MQNTTDKQEDNRLVNRILLLIHKYVHLFVSLCVVRKIAIVLFLSLFNMEKEQQNQLSFSEATSKGSLKLSRTKTSQNDFLDSHETRPSETRQKSKTMKQTRCKTSWPRLLT